MFTPRYPLETARLLIRPLTDADLDDLHAYLKHGNNVARFDFKYVSLPKSTPGFVSRAGAEGELSFDPDTLKPRPPKNKPAHTQADAPAEPAPSPSEVAAPSEAAKTDEAEEHSKTAQRRGHRHSPWESW